MLVDVRQLSEGYIINIGEVTLKRTTQFLGWGGGGTIIYLMMTIVVGVMVVMPLTVLRGIIRILARILGCS